MLASSVVMGGGFALLMASRFEVLSLIGLMTLVAAAAAVLADLLMFPAMFVSGARVGSRMQRRSTTKGGAK